MKTKKLPVFETESSALIINQDQINIPNKFKDELRNNFVILDNDFMEIYQDSYGLDDEDINYVAYISSSLVPISLEFMKFLKRQNEDFYGFTNGYDEYGNRLDMIKYFSNGE
jgi:hypothetical protein